MTGPGIAFHSPTRSMAGLRSLGFANYLSPALRAKIIKIPKERKDRKKGRGREAERDRYCPSALLVIFRATLTSFEFLIFIPMVAENNPEERTGMRTEIS